MGGRAGEGGREEILTKPRYTHKSPDTTRPLPVFYRAARRRRNSVTGQFLQRKIRSLSSLPPLALPSLLFSVHPTCYHSVTSAPGSCFHHPLPSAPPSRCRFFIGALHSARHVPLPSFHPSSCRSLNPPSFAPLGPRASRFSSRSPKAVSTRRPIST